MTSKHPLPMTSCKPRKGGAGCPCPQDCTHTLLTRGWGSGLGEDEEERKRATMKLQENDGLLNLFGMS